MESELTQAPAATAVTEDRAAFLRRVATWTVGGLAITAVVSLLSVFFIVPAAYKLGSWGVLAIVYGSMLLSQTVARGMVYGTAKVPGFLLGTSLQGIALGFLLTFAAFGGGDVGQGLAMIGYALLMTLLASLAMLAYVTIEKREFSLLRAGLTMLFVPMLALMVLQLVFPIGGTLGIVMAAVFVAISVGAMLWKLNFIWYNMETNRTIEGGYELTLGIVVLFWNLLSLFSRLRRR